MLQNLLLHLLDVKDDTMKLNNEWGFLNFFIGLTLAIYALWLNFFLTKMRFNPAKVTSLKGDAKTTPAYFISPFLIGPIM